MPNRGWGRIALCLGALTSGCGSEPTEPAPGALELTITTTGRDFDPDGYTATIDGGVPLAVPANGTVSIPSLSPGVHSVTLAGLAGNCALTTPAPLEVTVPGAAGAVASVEITCTQLYALAYWGPSGLELTDAAGTIHRTLVPDAGPLDWSPDGRMLAIAKPLDKSAVWLVNPDDGGVREFHRLGNSYFTTGRWSPDGRELLLESYLGIVSNNCHSGLARFPIDGSYPPVPVYGSSSPFQCMGYSMKGWIWPDWSPDGNRMVVQSTFSPALSVVSHDGTSQQFLADGRQPEWSPEGNAIVYVAMDGSFELTALHLISPDGSHDRPLTAPAPAEGDRDPAWSPDGSRVAFVRRVYAPDKTVTSVLGYLVDVDGSNARQVAQLPLSEVDVHPTWSPDGLHLAYSGYGGTHVVNADGTGFHLVSDVRAQTPALWRP